MIASRIASAFLAVLCCGAAVAQPGTHTDRAQAVKALTAPDAARRADAVIWIANNGRQSDEALLRKRLTDDNPLVRELAEQGVWMLWGRSGDDAVDRLMAKGGEQIEAGNLDDAIAIYSEVIKRKPDFAEGWNKRATVLFLAGDYRRSLADCDQVMKRNPNHFGALAGYGQIYFRLEMYEKAISYWKRALEVNPNMSGVEDGIEVAEQRLAAQRRNTT